MPLSRRARGRPASFDRQRGIETALLLFWKHGYAGVSIADLTTALRVTPPTLYAAFQSKEGLYRAVLHHYAHVICLDRVLALQQAPSAFRATELYLRVSAAHFSDRSMPAGCMISMGSLQSSTECAGIAAATADFRKGNFRAFTARYEMAIAAGELPARTDPAHLARFYLSVVHGMSTQSCDGADAAALHAIVDIALTAWPGSQLRHPPLTDPKSVGRAAKVRLGNRRNKRSLGPRR